MIQTVRAYGYNLGGSGAWNLFTFNAGDELHTAWCDETGPTHDFAACVTAAVAAGLRLPSAGQSGLGVPFTFVEALEVSPPGWTRETSAPLPLTRLRPTMSDLLSLDLLSLDRVGSSGVHTLVTERLTSGFTGLSAVLGILRFGPSRRRRTPACR